MYWVIVNKRLWIYRSKYDYIPTDYVKVRRKGGREKGRGGRRIFGENAFYGCIPRVAVEDEANRE